MFCWLATLRDDSSDMVEQPAFDLRSMQLSMSNPTMNATCVGCSSPGAFFVPELLLGLENDGFGARFNDPVCKLIENVASALWQSVDFRKYLDEAPDRCLRAAEYNQSEAPQLLKPWPL